MLKTRLSNLAVNAEVNAHAALLNGGWMDIYDGPQPEEADASPSGDAHLLASVRFRSPAFEQGLMGAAKARAMDSDPDAARTGDAAWYRLYQADHKTTVEDGSIGVKDANLILNSVHIQQHAEVTVRGFTLVSSKK